MTGTCRWLPFRIASGPANMALDEALLEQVAERGDLAYLTCLRLVGSHAQPGLFSAHRGA